MNNFLYKIVYGIAYAISLLPFKVLYVISDFVYLVVYYIVGYRKKTVRYNLASSFPEKDKKELRQIERRFFRFLCDCMVENIKLLSISREKLLRHVEFRNSEEVERCFDDGQTCALMLGHYCNWEFLTQVGISMKRHTDAVMIAIYHPLKSDIAEKLYTAFRQHHGSVCVPKNDILRRLITYKRENRMSLTGYVFDQSPKWQNIHLWLDFLGHDTPVFTGGERIIRKMNDAVFYADIQRPYRGKYIIDFELITRDPSSFEENGLTRLLFQKLEQNILRDPVYYLWSHKRWKRTHEEFDRRFIVKNGKVFKREKEED